jgi:hypothetical protein
MNMQYARMVFDHEQAHRDRVNAQSLEAFAAQRRIGAGQQTRQQRCLLEHQD